jgi:hypothetical protein
MATPFWFLNGVYDFWMDLFGKNSEIGRRLMRIERRFLSHQGAGEKLAQPSAPGFHALIMIENLLQLVEEFQPRSMQRVYENLSLYYRKTVFRIILVCNCLQYRPFRLVKSI